MNALTLSGYNGELQYFSVQFLVLAARCCWGWDSLGNPIQYDEIMEDITNFQYITWLMWLIFDSRNLTFTKNFCWRGTAHHGLNLCWRISQESFKVTNKSVDVSFTRSFQDDILVVVIAQTTWKLFIVHLWLVLALAP